MTSDPLTRLTSRRSLLRLMATGAGTATVAALAACTSTSPGTSPSRTTGGSNTAPTEESTTIPSASDSRVLIAYFSRAGENYWNGGRRTLETGNTEVLVELLRDRITADVYRIEAEETYSDSYDDTVARNVREQNSDARPAVANDLPDVSGYDTVILASPIWNVRPPMIMSTFVDGVDLSGKTVLPVVTYAVSGIGQAVDVYADVASGATIGDDLAVRGEQVPQSTDDIDAWIRRAGLPRR